MNDTYNGLPPGKTQGNESTAGQVGSNIAVDQQPCDLVSLTAMHMLR